MKKDMPFIICIKFLYTGVESSMSMKLVILGLLLEGDKHPYEVQHIMKERQMDCYIKYAKGSLYYAFEQLEKQGAIHITNVIRDNKST